MKKAGIQFSAGFSLIETMIVISIMVLVLGAVYAVYNLDQLAYRRGEANTELNQNGRVVLERLTREIRQANAIVTELPDLESYATDTIEFQDGHDISNIHYVEYFLDTAEKTVQRQVKAYYFSGDPLTYVYWNLTPPLGQTRETAILESPETIGEYVNDLKFWKISNIKISVSFGKGENSLQIRSEIFVRNI